jgi:hypothetical protein
VPPSQVWCSLGAEGGERRDSSAWVACRDFAALTQDVRAGIVTPAEIRPRLQAIDGNAQLAEDPEVRESARTMLREATAMEGAAGFEGAASKMSSACVKHAR